MRKEVKHLLVLGGAVLFLCFCLSLAVGLSNRGSVLADTLGGFFGMIITLAFAFWVLVAFVVCVVLLPFLIWFGYNDGKRIREILEVAYKDKLDAKVLDDYKDKQAKEFMRAEDRQKRNKEKIEKQRERQKHKQERDKAIDQAEYEIRKERMADYQARLDEGRTFWQFVDRNKWNIFPGLVVAVVVILLIVLT